MSTQVIVYILTVLAAVVIVLTRLRLGKDHGGAGRFQVGRRLLDVHTTAGVGALVVWVLSSSRTRALRWAAPPPASSRWPCGGSSSWQGC
ncbi:hypothetical protein [Nocardioides ungokensis]|uniref:hypothetical protein n=1 Tax=Nocardioides ungokensis TaxID=1643322 RepID=UPI001FE50A0C|nr:hypothetical protein [Nocardioides ungokensis]